MSEIEQNNIAKPKDKKQFHLGALILVIIIVFVLFKVNLEKAINSPQFQKNVNYIQVNSEKAFNYIWDNIFGKLKFPSIDPAKIDEVVKPDKVKDYFKVPTDEYINQYSSPTAN
jgi:hypothetical protein